MSSENAVEAAVEPAEKETKTPTQDILQAENDKEKSGDKREIEDEEREKMLNEENKKEPGEVEKKKKALEEAEREKEGTKRRIPTGGIKIPGFLRSRSRDKNKESDADGDEGADLLEPPCTATTVGSDDDKADTPTTKSRTTKFKFSNPFSKKKRQESVQSEGEPDAGGEPDIPLEKRPGFINAIKLPLVSVIPRKLRSAKDADSEEGSGGDNGGGGGGGGGGAPAGLASMETLEDSNGSHKPTDEEILEIVKLDSSLGQKMAMDSEKAAAIEEENDKWNEQDWSKRLKLLNEHKVAIIGVLIFVILLIVIIIVATVGPRHIPTAPVTQGRYTKAATSCGYVEGILEDSGVVFRGIPYALPPVGNLRWAPPHELHSIENCWNDTLKAHNSSSACWQIYSNGTIDGSEDCLYLDIVTPYVRYESPLPVVVLFGSESLTGGSPGILDMPLPRLSRAREVVFVRPNFRLGVLGFLAAAPLSRATHPPTSGNYGLLDAIAALRWIKLNIQNFGGDANSVTLLGHRAGATLVTALTSSKKASELFTQAWVSSGSANYPGLPLTESERDTEHQYLAAFSTDREIDAAYLRRQDVEDLLDNVPDEWRRDTPDLPERNEENKTKHHWMVLDGAILQEHPLEIWGKMNISGRLVIGTTAHSEATQSLKSLRAEWLPEDVAHHVRASRLGSLGLAEEALRRYGSTFEGLAAMISDIRTVCPLLTLARKIQQTPFYVVTQTRDGLADVDTDVAAILGRYKAKSPEQRRYLQTIQQIFYRFVAHHKFDHPAADASNNKILLIGQDPVITQEYPNCDFWISKDIVPRYSRVD